MIRSIALTLLVFVAVVPAVVSAQQVEDRITAEVQRMDVLDHARLVLRLRKELDKRLLTPGEQWAKKQPKGEATGVHKILVRGRWEWQTFVRGGGAYFSFETESNDYNQRPDLQLSKAWTLSSGFAGGDVGAVVPIQAKKLDKLEADDLPDWLTAPDAHAFHDAMRTQPIEPAAAAVGQVYAIRSLRWGESDRLVVMKVLDRGEFGLAFAWKVLQVRDVPVRR